MPADDCKRVALVTGATGFVGGHLVRRLCNEGWQVHAIVRPSSHLHLLKGIVDRLTIHTFEGATEGMSAIICKASPRVVFHLASLYLTEHQSKEIEPLLHSNVLFGTQLLEAMVSQNIHYLVNTGTAWQHYEGHNYSPVNLYAATKQAFESILQFYVEASPLRAITLKLFDTYGPNDPRRKLFVLLREAARAGQPLLMSEGEQLLDLVHVDDVVDAFVLAAMRVQSDNVVGHEYYAVSSGTPRRLRDIVELYEKQTGQHVPIQWGGRPYRKREVMTPWNRGPSLPGWRPSRSLADWLRADATERLVHGGN